MVSQECNRRAALRVMVCLGGGAALASLSGCDKPQAKQQLTALSSVSISIGGTLMLVPDCTVSKVAGVVLLAAGGVLAVAVIFSDGTQAEVAATPEQIAAVQQAAKAGEKAEVKQGSEVKKVAVTKK